MAKKIKYRSALNNKEESVNDSQDLLQKHDANTFAIIRSSECKSTFLVGVMNRLGKMGVYDTILRKISDTQNWCPIDLVYNYIEGLGNLHALFLKQYASEYIPKLKEAVFNNILKSPDANLRNFSKEKIEAICKGMSKLLKRVMSVDEKCYVIFIVNDCLIFRC